MGSTSQGTMLFTRGIELYQWQRDALEAWSESEGRGTLKVVTGAGKTVLGLSVIERLSSNNPELRVAIVVPTIVLMQQWAKEFEEKGNLAPHSIGLAGGNRKASYVNGTKIIIWVLPTASKKLADDVAEADVGDDLLLIVDECHRAGAAVMSRIFRTSRRWSLGLSATPERNEDIDESGEDEEQVLLDDGPVPDLEYSRTPLGKELGPIVYELSLRRAIDLGVLPSFDVRHYGLALEGFERARYDSLSHSITDARKQLQGVLGGARSLIPFARKVASGSGDMAPAARRFINGSQERKRLLFQASARHRAVSYLLQQEFEDNPDARVIIFHESIAEVERLAGELVESLPAYASRIATEHSKRPAKLRSATITAFSEGSVQVLVSVKSLIEGFNVPEADVGIIVASSTSVRQRVQTMGRILRRHTTEDGVQKHPRMHVLYIRDSVDDAIYGLEDWGESTGYERNEYFQFLPPDAPESLQGPPRLPLPDEQNVDDSNLSKGDLYPGKYQGEEFTSDTRGNIKRPGGALIPGCQDVWKDVVEVKGNPGRFIVTPRKRLILVRTMEEGSWVTRYVGTWTSDVTPDYAEHGYTGPTDSDRGKYRIRQRAGRRVVCWEVNTGNRREEHCLAADDDDPRSGDVSRLLSGIADLESSGLILRHFQINSSGHAIGAYGGQWHLISAVSRSFNININS